LFYRFYSRIISVIEPNALTKPNNLSHDGYHHCKLITSKLVHSLRLIIHCHSITTMGLCINLISWQSACRWLGSHKLSGRLLLFSTRSTVTFPANEITPACTVPNYTAWWQRQTGVGGLPKATTQWCPARTQTCDLRISSPLPCHEWHHITVNELPQNFSAHYLLLPLGPIICTIESNPLQRNVQCNTETQKISSSEKYWRSMECRYWLNVTCYFSR